MFGEVSKAIGDAGGDIGAVDLVKTGGDSVVRDFTINCTSVHHAQEVIDAIAKVKGVKVISASDDTFLMHLGGKIEVTNKVPVKTRADMSMAYTPGVGRVCMAIHDDPKKVYQLTIKKNIVAIVTDGTAVLGLGDIGPEAALPVMEGKAMLFKEFGGVDAFPICLATKDPDTIVEAVKLIAPVFGGINLEDISAPRCFYVEERLKKELDIPVFHDDQHGTAVVVLAGLINALKVVKKEMEEIKVVVLGVGAAGVAVTKMLMSAGVKDFIGCDRQGTLYKGRDMGGNPAKEWYAENTNRQKVKGGVKEALEGADVFIGVSGPGLVQAGYLKKMKRDPVVFAMSNPVPEIMPEEAAPYVKVMATGRSDYPNQVNNVLCFPGIFRGALDSRATDINEPMKLAAAHAIASAITDTELSADYVIPGVFNRTVFKKVSEEVAKAAVKSGVARKSDKSTAYAAQLSWNANQFGE
jgi:malate dehydrogenase (oxaloacetate-decarboxylating)